jgi:hypothetical protein
MVAFRGTFDGRTIVLDGQRAATPPQRVLVHVEPLSESTLSPAAAGPRGAPGSRLLPLAGSIAPEDLATMQEAIREGCERVDPDAW